jgi:hypothetical protein
VRLLPLFVCCAGVLAGCQVTPNPADTTNAKLRFRIHYLQPGPASPNVEVRTSSSIEARQCVYVASLFGVSANAGDADGIRYINIGASAYFDALKARGLSGDTVALPGPSVPTQPASGGGTMPNPGSVPGSALVTVSYDPGTAFSNVTLAGTYQFAPGASLGALHGTVHNFGSTTGVSEVYHFYVRPATASPTQQPGMSCPLP